MKKDIPIDKLIKYHVSKGYLGRSVTLNPQLPKSALISIEGDIPRVCFSTELSGCLSSISGGANCSISDALLEFKDKNIFPNPSVYITIEDLFTPPNISDFRENNEYWALIPIKVKFIGFIDLFQLTKNIIEITMERFTLTNEIYRKEYKTLFTLKIKESKIKEISLNIPKNSIKYLKYDYNNSNVASPKYIWSNPVDF